MRAKAIAAILALAVVAAVVAPTGAAAKAHSRRTPASVSYDFKLAGSSGYKIEAFGDSHEVSIVVHRKEGKRSASSVDYTVHPKVRFDGSAVDLKLPGLADFEARFVARSSREPKPEALCKGEPTVVDKGFFVGTFSFRGERGFTTATATRAAGSVIRVAAQTCKLPPREPVHHQSRAELEEEEQQAGERIVQLVAGERASGLNLVVARSESTLGKHSFGDTVLLASEDSEAHGVHAVHSVIDLKVPKTAFEVPQPASPPPTEATLTAPSPFSGSSTFQLLGPKQASWTGDLAVELPGLGRVQLSGPKFYAGLCEGAKCTKTLPREFDPSRG